MIYGLPGTGGDFGRLDPGVQTTRMDGIREKVGWVELD